MPDFKYVNKKKNIEIHITNNAKKKPEHFNDHVLVTMSDLDLHL